MFNWQALALLAFQIACDSTLRRFKTAIAVQTTVALRIFGNAFKVEPLQLNEAIRPSLKAAGTVPHQVLCERNSR